MIQDDELYNLVLARRKLARDLRDATAALLTCRKALAELVRRAEDPDLAHDVAGAWETLGVALDGGREALRATSDIVKVRNQP